MVSMLVSHHAVQLETTIYNKLCYKSSPPPILYRYHHKMPPFQQLPKKKFLKETEKKKGQLDLHHDEKNNSYKNN